MSDQETNQILRDILAGQREQLGRLEQQDRTFEQHLQRQEKLYTDSLQRYSERHAEAMEQYRRAERVRPWALGILVVTMLGNVLITGYLLFRHFQV
jgi:hypothetical protein